MSKAINSPTARLLRSSRLFSLPPPLPAPSLEAVNSSGTLRSSDTATLPYPTHQAISTPPSSRHRGDWGLKRPLPDRSIPKNKAHVRIKAIDNVNHITEFASAADHTQTVEKWQNMNMPVSMAQARDSMTRRNRNPPVSAFENDVDNTAFGSTSKDLDSLDISTERAIILRSLSPTPQNNSPNRQRWKTSGPWVNGLTEQDFQEYLAKTVRKHKPAFLKFLEHVKSSQKKNQILQTMRDEGLLSEVDAKTLDFELEKQSQLDEHELDDYIKELRDNNSGLSSELSTLVRQYFDLPAFPTINEAQTGNNLYANLLSSEDSSSENPPATHPSAGLSYIRTRAFMQNHPTYGPQESHEPVQARVVRPRSAVGAGSDRKANLGVAGFITEESGHSTFAPKMMKNDNLTPEQQYIHNVSYLDIDTPGGNKVWVHPIKAHVDEKGHIRLTVDRADEQSVGVKTGNPIEAPAILSSSRYAGRLNEPLDSRPLPGLRGNANFARALPRTAQAFDDADLEKARPKGVEGDEDQIRMIEQLARQHMDDESRS
ncbi:mitochondrial ribosomal protein MRP51 [Delphinella strobiligena]|nr:mitochondrial ribosomal protein MRP51 [Delphinella strobiligena]